MVIPFGLNVSPRSKPGQRRMFRASGWRDFPIAGGETRQLLPKIAHFKQKMADIRVWHGS